MAEQKPYSEIEKLKHFTQQDLPLVKNEGIENLKGTHEELKEETEAIKETGVPDEREKMKLSTFPHELE